MINSVLKAWADTVWGDSRQRYRVRVMAPGTVTPVERKAPGHRTGQVLVRFWPDGEWQQASCQYQSDTELPMITWLTLTIDRPMLVVVNGETETRILFVPDDTQATVDERERSAWEQRLYERVSRIRMATGMQKRQAYTFAYRIYPYPWAPIVDLAIYLLERSKGDRKRAKTTADQLDGWPLDPPLPDRFQYVHALSAAERARLVNYVTYCLSVMH